jgi:hypothetical protein
MQTASTPNKIEILTKVFNEEMNKRANCVNYKINE